MHESTYDVQLFAELYDIQPQPIIWMCPIWDEGKQHITDFKYVYANDEGLKYANLTRDQFINLTHFNTPTISEDLRTSVFEQLLSVYTTGKKMEAIVYNQALDKYYRILRTKLRDGVLNVIQDRTQENRSILQLEKQSNYLNSVLNTSLSAVVTMEAVRDKDGVIVDLCYRQVNTQFLNWFSITENDVLGKSMLQLFPGTKDTGIFSLYCEVIENGNSIKSEVPYYDDNRELWLELSIVRLDSKTAVATFNDITSRKQAYKQVEEQKTLLDNILKNSSNGISVTEAVRDERGVVIDAKTILANEAAVRFTGLPLDIYLSKTAVELDPYIIGSPYYQAYVKTLETGESALLQYQLQQTNRWLELTISRMDENHVIHVFTDVTAIKEAHLRMEQSASKLRTVIDTAQAGFLLARPVTDENGEIIDFAFTMVNNVLASFTGKAPEELHGELGSRWFARYKTNGLFERFRHVYLTGEKQAFDFHYVTESIEVWANIMTTRIDDELLCSFTNFTPLKQTQFQLERTIEELQRSNAHLEDFAHAASHDMKEPLRKIRTFTDRLRNNLGARLTNTETEFVSRIENAAERMQQLVDDLLEFSHVSERPHQLELVDLKEKVQKVLVDLDLPIEEKGAKIEVGPLPTVAGNRRQLQQLFHNLIGNALKYSKPEIAPDIRICSRLVRGAEAPINLSSEQAEKQFYLIEVSDNGIGFEQQYAEQIFGMFQRLHGKAEYAGTGVGLSIARKVAENHNGYIWATSEPGVGATFHLLLPA
jgi:signal transduction histidine kinase